MKAFEIEFGNTKLWGAGTHVSVDLTILANNITDALIKAGDAVEAVKEGLKKVGYDRSIGDIRVMKVEEKDPVLNPNGVLDADMVTEVVASMKEDLSTE